MATEKHKFQRYTDDAAFEKPDIISVKLNREERRWLEALKKYHRTTQDSTALKNEAFRIYKQCRELERLN